MKIESIPIYWKEGKRGRFDSDMELVKSDDAAIDRSQDSALFKYEQIAVADSKDLNKPKFIQSFVLNMTSPNKVDQLIKEQRPLPEEIIVSDKTTDEVNWTVSRASIVDDVVFFMYAKTAKTNLTRLRTEIRSNSKYSIKTRGELLKLIEDHLAVYSQLGGKIFAVGHIRSGPVRCHREDENLHWHSCYYADVDNLYVFKKPISITEFPFIRVSRQSSITLLSDKEYDSLRKVVEGHNNTLPDYVKNSIARPMPLWKINKENWIGLTNEFERRFSSEKQLRTFYLDYLLSAIGDQKRFFTECRCSRPNMNDSFMDYVIRFNGKFLPVEAKLLVNGSESLIKTQVSKYVNNSCIILDNKGRKITGSDRHPDKVLVIDKETIYMYDGKKDSLDVIFELKNLNNTADLKTVRNIIIHHL